jgi:hypothetical protein
MSATAAAPKRSRAVNLADVLATQMAAIRDHHYLPLGVVMRIQLGICDEAAYFQEEIRKRLAPITRVQGLILDWDQNTCPQIAEMQTGSSGRTMQFLFPRGVAAPPKISDPRYQKLHIAAPDPPQISQDIDYYASGKIVQRDGTMYRVLQPIEQICVRPYGVSTFILLWGRTNPWNGTKVAMLYKPPRNGSMGTAFLTGGLLSFD